MAEITFDNILLLTIFFVPGFVYLKSYRLFIAETKTDFSKDLYEAFGFSFINAIIFSYPIYLINQKEFIEQKAFWYFAILFFIVIVAPVVGALFFHVISKRKWFTSFLISPTKSAWDSFFSNRQSFWVIVTLKNGRKIGGKYGVKSYSSTYPNPNEIYIEEVWKLNEAGGFEEKEAQTAGMIITENEISTIEFFN